LGHDRCQTAIKSHPHPQADGGPELAIYRRYPLPESTLTSHIPALFLSLLVACSVSQGENEDDTGTHEGRPDSLECSDTSTTLASDEASVLGFSADEVLAVMAGPVDAAGTWSADDSAVLVTLSVVAAGDAVFHEREPVEDTGVPDDTGFEMGAPDDGCPDWVEIPVQLALTTDDGAFDETVVGSVLAMDTASLWVSADLDWTALTGTFTFTEIDPAEWDQVTLSVSAGWVDGSPTGQVDMNASRKVSEDMGEGMVGPVLLW
jgi:hypothetical protein